MSIFKQTKSNKYPEKGGCVTQYIGTKKVGVQLCIELRWSCPTSMNLIHWVVMAYGQVPESLVGTLRYLIAVHDQISVHAGIFSEN